MGGPAESSGAVNTVPIEPALTSPQSPKHQLNFHAACDATKNESTYRMGIYCASASVAL